MWHLIIELIQTMLWLVLAVAGAVALVAFKLLKWSISRLVRWLWQAGARHRQSRASGSPAASQSHPQVAPAVVRKVLPELPVYRPYQH
jgi:hypothetical protein